MPPPSKKPDSGLRDLAVAFTMATNFVITFVLFAGIGYGIDWWRSRGGGGGGYTFTLIGTGLGLVFAVARIVIDTQRMEAAEKRRKEREGAGQKPAAGDARPPRRP